MTGSTDWRTRFRALLPLLGHRNWILVADAAYPAQVGAVEILDTGDALLPVVEEVLRDLQAAPHVAPVVRLDAELDYLTDELAPGVTELRAALHTRLSQHAPTPVLHQELIERLGEVARSFQVLVLKTSSTVPYSSVFIELGCGYWSPEDEGRLRALMP